MSEKQKQLSLIIEEIGTLATYNSFGVINMMLSKGIKRIDEMSPEKIVTYARSVFAIRDNVPLWESFVKAADISLTKRGLDSKKILKGLF
jgi:hypothetical protein